MYIHIYINVYIYKYIYVYIYTYIYIHICIYMCLCVCSCVYTYVCTCIYIYMYQVLFLEDKLVGRVAARRERISAQYSKLRKHYARSWQVIQEFAHLLKAILF